MLLLVLNKFRILHVHKGKLRFLNFLVTYILSTFIVCRGLADILLFKSSGQVVTSPTRRRPSKRAYDLQVHKLLGHLHLPLISVPLFLIPNSRVRRCGQHCSAEPYMVGLKEPVPRSDDGWCSLNYSWPTVSARPGNGTAHWARLESCRAWAGPRAAARPPARPGRHADGPLGTLQARPI